MLRLTPEFPADQAESEGIPSDVAPGRIEGWELVSSRVAADGAEVQVFRRPA
jgi:hypothetical protein